MDEAHKNKMLRTTVKYWTACFFISLVSQVPNYSGNNKTFFNCL